MTWCLQLCLGSWGGLEDNLKTRRGVAIDDGFGLYMGFPVRGGILVKIEAFNSIFKILWFVSGGELAGLMGSQRFLLRYKVFSLESTVRDGFQSGSAIHLNHPKGYALNTSGEWDGASYNAYSCTRTVQEIIVCCG
ncbi:hypothetical protein GJ496_003909 [Pomphorhynchus laevis]|nr:hypothetical protein GJ496_003909 [Pomphorhynchus laevis]